MPLQLIDHPLGHGPEWLQQPSTYWPIQTDDCNSVQDISAELKPK